MGSYLWWTDISKCLLNGDSQNDEPSSYIFTGEATPVKACGDLVYQVNSAGMTVSISHFPPPWSRIISL